MTTLIKSLKSTCMVAHQPLHEGRQVPDRVRQVRHRLLEKQEGQRHFIKKQETCSCFPLGPNLCQRVSPCKITKWHCIALHFIEALQPCHCQPRSDLCHQLDVMHPFQSKRCNIIILWDLQVLMFNKHFSRTLRSVSLDFWDQIHCDYIWRL